MKVRMLGAVTIAAALAGACDSAVSPQPQEQMSLSYDFNTGTHSFTAAFTDYEAGLDSIYEMESGLRALPLPLDTTKQGYMLSSMNRSDDMFQYVRRQVGGLVPDTEYAIRFRVDLATDAPHGCVGVGGAPGEAVVLKAGASAEEPKPVLQDGDYRLSVDKGEQMEEGTAVLILGDIANSSDDCHNPPYEMKSFDSAPRTLRAKTDAAGRLWLFAGTESGFEARTRIYITRLRVDLEAAGS
jgi:hypothetical protein